MSASMIVTIGDNEPSSETVAEIAEEIGNTSLSAIEQEELIPKLVKLKEAASQFMTKYNASVALLEDLSANYQMIQKLQQQIDNQLMAEDDGVVAIESYQNALAEVKVQLNANKIGEQIYSAVFDFQAALNDFFDQQMVLTIVYRNDVYTTTLHDYAQYLEYSYTKGELSARFSNLRKMIDGLGMTKWTDPNYLKSMDYNLNAVKNVQHAKRSTLWRFNRSKSILKKYNGSGGLVLWHRPNWVGMWISNRGDINEAYASIILSKTAVDAFASGDIDTLLDLFLLTYVADVDATSGILRGDYSNAQNNLEYAVKSSRAAALGYKQFIPVAQMILSDDFNINELEAWKEENIVSKGKRNVQVDLSQITREVLMELIAGSVSD